ncbi:MAG: adenine nucleotide alpha hydrolase [Planctomycetes bacterium]|jgi:uncharacterized protein (TIGR00290 family)|nr:adenine nucleotide alpha hydrolase [Planctomycetota bacterium]MBT4029411.1 adenine nucleotide alpha hydrolase [Planctomycetota bacterium]MBT4560784.1 adenine nucleotide alpha hydrolase [Planctomycetota bacterium]MBT5100688.1 adenine nucleotide alpha hydrolase [Planctomycetota bacterium]MBT5119922.1 adenine nucleotide alpha hydrolase [Planctomycetota bacterium]
MKTLLSWSGGKDSALALRALRRDANIELVGLLTTLSQEHDRISMHGVRSELLDLQSCAAGLSSWRVAIPAPTSDCPICPIEDSDCPVEQDTNCPIDTSGTPYDAAMGAAMKEAVSQGVEAIAFGDIFLEDLRAYREKRLAEVGLKAIFPLWGRDSTELFEEFIAAGFHAITTCVDGSKLDQSWVGRPLDAAFLADYKAQYPDLDPCGENGEFHSFVTNGPVFSRPVDYKLAETVSRDSFWFQDLLPIGAPACSLQYP